MKVLLLIALTGFAYGDKPIDGHHLHHDDHHHDDHHHAHHDDHHTDHHESLRLTPASTTLLVGSSAPVAPVAPAAPAEEIIFLAPEEPQALPQGVIRQAPQQLVPQQVSQETQAVFVQNFDSPLVSSGGFVPIDTPQRGALPPTRANLPSITQPGIPINAGEPLPLEPLRAAAPDAGASSYVSFNGASNFDLDGRAQPQPFREETHHQQHHHNSHQPQPVFNSAPQPVHQQSYSAPAPAPVYHAPAPVYNAPAPAPAYGAPKAPKAKGQHFQKPKAELPKVKGGIGLLKIPSFEQVVKGSQKIFKDITKDLPDIDDIKESFKFELPEFDIKGAFDSAYEDVKYGLDSFKESIDIFDFAGKGEKGEKGGYESYDAPNYQYEAPVSYEHQAPVYEHQAPVYEHQAPVYEHQAPAYEHHAPAYEHHAPAYEHQAPVYEHQAPAYEQKGKGEKGAFDWFNKGEKASKGTFDFFDKGEKASKGAFDWFSKGDKASKGTFDFFDKGEKASKGAFDWFNKGDKGHFDFIKAHFNKGSKGNKGFNKAPKDTYGPPPVAPQPTYGYHAPPQQNYGPPPQTYGAPQPSYHLESSVSDAVRVL